MASPRSTHVQNYLKDNGVVLEDFETLSQWAVANGVKSSNTSEFLSGTKSIKLAVNSGVPDSPMTKDVSLNIGGKSKSMVLRCYCHDDPMTTIQSMQVYLSSSTTFAKFLVATFDRYQLGKGWNYLRISNLDWDNIGGESFDNTMVKLRLKVTPQSGQTPSVSFDEMSMGIVGVPKVMIVADDGWDDVYQEMYNYMKTKGVKGTAYIVSGSIDVNANCMTTAQLNEMYAAGWAIANHTANHVNLTTLGTQEEVEYQLKTCSDWLINKGFTRSAYHVAYPNGGYNNTVLAAMKKLGMTTGRTIHNVTQGTPLVGDDRYLLRAYSLPNTSTLAQVKKFVMSAFRSGSTAIINFHQIVASPSISTEWAISDFRALIDWLIALNVQFVTIDEWWEGLINPRYRSK